MTMKELAGLVGLSESMVSQIETNRVSPSLDSLLAICQALDVDMEWLFRDFRRTRSVSLVRRDERKRTQLPLVVFNHLSRESDVMWQHGVEAYLLEIQPGGEKGDSTYGHVGSEWGYVLAGTAELSYGASRYELRTGDAVSFASDIPHTLKNAGKGALKALWVVTPPKGQGA